MPIGKEHVQQRFSRSAMNQRNCADNRPHRCLGKDEVFWDVANNGDFCPSTSSVLPLASPFSTDHEDPSSNFFWTTRLDDTNLRFGFSACFMCSAPNSNTIYVALFFWSFLVFLFYHISWETTSVSRKKKKEKKGSMQPATSEMTSKQRFTFGNIAKIFNLQPLAISSFKLVGNKR